MGSGRLQTVESMSAVYSLFQEWNYNLYDVSSTEVVRRRLFGWIYRLKEKFQVWPARKFVSEAIRYNIEEFHIDGLRFDSARQIQHFEFLSSVVQQSKDIAPKAFYSIAEYLPDHPGRRSLRQLCSSR